MKKILNQIKHNRTCYNFLYELIKNSTIFIQTKFPCRFFFEYNGEILFEYNKYHGWILVDTEKVWDICEHKYNCDDETIQTMFYDILDGDIPLLDYYMIGSATPSWSKMCNDIKIGNTYHYNRDAYDIPYI